MISSRKKLPSRTSPGVKAFHHTILRVKDNLRCANQPFYKVNIQWTRSIDKPSWEEETEMLSLLRQGLRLDRVH